MKKQGPLLGDVLVGVPHDGIEDRLKRIEWLKSNAPENTGAMADAKAKLARDLKREQAS